MSLEWFGECQQAGLLAELFWESGSSRSDQLSMAHASGRVTLLAGIYVPTLYRSLSDL